MGTLDALFVADADEAERIIEMKSFWLHDILGKHSEVEVYPDSCKIILRETPELKTAFDALSKLDIGISGDFLDRVRDPEYFI